MNEFPQKTNKKKALFITVAALLLLVILSSVTYAWLSGAGSIPCPVVEGSILTQYFHCGTGTEEDPFVITRPIHFYNLVYLYQRKEGFSDSGYYFRVGYNLDNSEDGSLEVYSYRDNGEVIPNTYTSALNLECYSGDKALLPVGTSETPFVGTFDGSGLTVENVHIKSYEEFGDDEVYKTCDVGIFGYVSGLETYDGREINGTIKNVFFKGVTLDLSGADPTAECHGKAAVHDTIPDEASTQDMVFVGYLAGHVKTTSMMENVYVNDCTITGGTLSDSKFGYFGVVEDSSTGKMVTALGKKVATLREAGDEAGFGGSLDMQGLYNRIRNVLSNTTYNNVSRVTTYPSEESITMPSEKDGKPVVTFDDTEAIGRNDNNDSVYRWQTPTAGSYIGSTSSTYTYLYSLKSTQTTTVTMYTQTGEMVPAWLISYDGKYLTTNGTAISNTAASEAGAKKWLKDANGHWYTYINNKVYYLNANGTSGIQLVDTAVTGATVWAQNADGSFTTVIGGTPYYLIYNSGWALTPTKESYVISDGGTHFLTGSNTGVGNVSSANESSPWQVEQNGDNYKIWLLINGTRYYLGFRDGLTMVTTETTWTKDGNGLYTTVAGEKLYLGYDGGWKVFVYNGRKIHSSNIHYLTASSTGVFDGDASEGNYWFFSSETGDTQIYTVVGTAKYYLTYNGNYGLSVSTTVATWHRDGDNSFYYTQNGVNYYLQYSGAWAALPLAYHVIGDGNGHYMKATSANNFDVADSIADATKFYFSDTDTTPSGTIKYVIGGNVCTLGNNNGAFANAATTWVNDGDGKLHVGTYYLTYTDGDWKILNKPYRFYITDGTNYLNVTTGNNPALSTGTNKSTATLWTFANSTDLNNPSGVVSVEIGERTYYLRVNRTSSGGCNPTYTYDLQLSTTNSNNAWTINNNQLRNNQYTDQRLVITGNGSLAETGTTLQNPLPNARDLSGTDIAITANTAAKPVLTVDVPETGKPTVSVTGPIEKDVTVTFTETEEQMYTATQKTVRRGTYIPLRTNSEDEGYSEGDNYGVSKFNTGYIVGGTYSAATGSGQGDIRVSSYSRVIGNSYANGDFTHVYTFTGTGSAVEITAANQESFTQLASVKDKFKQIQGTSTTAYGLHFMNAAISTDHIIQAETATLMSGSYVNYDLPESCIDFTVIEKGYITFMAGDYFDGNNAFFSLHQVIRDENMTITAIKEISQVYKKKNDEFAPYVYKYVKASDGYSVENFVASDYDLVFDTKLITNPTNGSSSFSNNRIYYFEIPCNKGEYALGSVEGKTGAYLLYLDIATNGGVVLESIVSGEGNTDTEMLQVEYRNAGDTDVPTLEHSILQFEVNAPAATAENFSIHVNFDQSDTGDSAVSCPKGCYTITIVNKTGTDVLLQILLCDYDDNPNNEFEYAYKIKYSNNNNTDQFLPREVGSSKYNYWKAVGSFVIPASGTASEANYNSGT